MATTTVTIDQVKALSLQCEFDGLTEDQIQARIDRACMFINTDVWDRELAGRADEAIKNLAAHFLVMDARPAFGPGGAVVSESADGMARSYAGPVTNVLADGFLAATQYGRIVLALKKTLPLTPLTLCTDKAASLAKAVP